MALELLVVAAAAWLVRRWSAEEDRNRREWTLVAISAALIAYWQPLALLVSLVLTLGTWAAIREHRRARIPTRVVVAVLVLALVLFRTAPTVDRMWEGKSDRWPLLLGISFLVFRLIGVVMDASALRIPVGARKLLLLSLFFPTYRSGPITTLHSFEALSAESIDFRRAVDRIVLGLARKCLLADFLYSLVVRPWSVAGSDRLSPDQCLLLPFAIGLWIYWDFAGYSDIAIGAAALVGYRVPENFDRPYQSRNLVEFWRRWHMTLSEWIRSRVFLKLTGRRPSTLRVCAAAVAAMVLCGLWHGPRAGFVLWGLWHGIGLATVLVVGAAGRRYEALRFLLGRRWMVWCAMAVTYVWVNVGYLPFLMGVNGGLGVAAKAADAVLHARGGLVVLGLMGTLLLLARIAAAAARMWMEGTPDPIRGVVYALVLAGAVAAGAEPFVYFRF